MIKNNDQEFPTPQDAQEGIFSPITKALTDNNITLDRLSKKVSKLIDCKRGIGVDLKGRSVNVPDNPSQLKAVDMALKLSQAYPAEKHDVRVMGETEMSLAVTVYRASIDTAPSIEDKDETSKHKDIKG